MTGLVLTNNAAMLAMGQKMGFSVARDPESSEYRLTIPLRDLA